jgi:hypothetical protein
MTSLVLAATLLAAPPPRDSCGRIALLPAYAHNDYRNTRPLFDALSLGYRGVEADLFRTDTALLVGHDRKELSGVRSLVRLYLDPLRTRLRACGYILSDSTPFLLDVELKEKDPAAFQLLVDYLRAYAELFEARQISGAPPVRVALVGWWPAAGARPPWPSDLGVQVIVDQRGRAQGDTAGVPVALVTIDYGRALRWAGHGPIPAPSRAALATARGLAAALGVPLRVHHAPVSANVYHWLLAEGVTLIGTTDLARTSELLRQR